MIYSRQIIKFLLLEDMYQFFLFSERQKIKLEKKSWTMEVNKTRNEIIQDRQMEIRLKKGKLPGICAQLQRLILKCLHSITVRIIL